MKTAKAFVSCLLLVGFAGGMLGCHSDDDDAPRRTSSSSSTYDNGSSRTYKKTTYTDSNGNTSTRTESVQNNE